MIRKGFVQEDNVIIGKNFDIGYYVILRNDVIIGDNVCIWSHTVVDPGSRIGNNVKIHCGCYIAQNSVIQDNVFMGPGVKLFNDKYPPRYNPDDWEPVIIKKGAIIGGGVCICPGVVIDSGIVVGAGSVIFRSLTNNDPRTKQVWAGNPARRIK